MKLILHIGTEKTGTTTTQRWAARNRDALMRQGVRYSRVLGSTSHVKLYLWCLAPWRSDEGFTRVNVVSQDDLRDFRSQLQDEFAGEVREARESGCHTFLISNELCHSRLATQEEVQRAGDFLKPHFDDIEVICALRPQIDLAVSFASNAAKGGDRITGAYFDRIDPELSYYNYRRLAERWSAVFGTDKMKLVPFRRTPDFTDVVAERAGIDTSGLQPPVRSNEALDVRVMALTNAMKIESLEGRQIEPFAYIPREVLHRLPCEQRLQPGLKLAGSVQARFEDDNRELTRGRTDIDMADLTPDWSRYTAPSNLAMLERPCAFSGELAALVQVFNQNLALARVQYEIAAAERHLDLLHPSIAERRLKSALRLVALLEQAGTPGDRTRRLRARTASLQEQLEQSGDRSARRRRRGDKQRGGRRRSNANGRRRESEPSAGEQDPP